MGNKNEQQSLESIVINDLCGKIANLEGNLSLANAKVYMLEQELIRLQEEADSQEKKQAQQEQ